MEGLAVVILGLILCVLVLPIVAMLRSGRALHNMQLLQQRIESLERELRRLKDNAGASIERTTDEQRQPTQPDAAPDTAATPAEGLAAQLPDLGAMATPRWTQQTQAAAPISESKDLAAEVAKVSEEQLSTPPILPPPLVSQPNPSPEPAFSFDKIKGSLNWEQFMGAKLFAWIGGLALFLGVAYFVKYSFEHNLIPPEIRVALGFLTGIGLVVGGVALRRKEFTTTAQTLCATGVVILYAVTFACRAVYHFPFFGAGATFALMALITASAFILAVRLEAQVVCLLGMLGGFVTPILLSTGQDAPIALFAYIGLLDAGLLAVALYRGWFYLAPLAALGTMAMQIGWTAKFFETGMYFSGNKVLIPLTVLVAFNGLWLGASRIAKARGETQHYVSSSTVALSGVALAFAFYFFGFKTLTARPWLILSFALVIDGAVLALTRIDRWLAPAQSLAGGVMFLLLASFIGQQNSNAQLPAVLVFTLVFAASHSVIPLALSRRDSASPDSPKWTGLFPALALLVLLLPIFKFAVLTIFIWPVVLLLDLLAVALAALTASATPVIAMLGLTLIAIGGVVFKIPADLAGFGLITILLGLFAILFAAAGIWLHRKASLPSDEAAASKKLDAAIVAQIPALSTVLPFALLVLIVGQLPLTNPSAVFGLALLLTAMLFAISRMFRLEWLPLLGLGSVAALEYAWHFRLFKPAFAIVPLVWYLIFFVVFAAAPFIFTRHWSHAAGPWVAAALAGPIQFLPIYKLTKTTWPNSMMGLLAAAFALPALASLAAVLRLISRESPSKLTQLALFGGVGLFFITLIFPLQFHRQWLTIAWALEGAALCWLFHRIPHSGLRLTGVVLLVVAFTRLALNKAVLSYHVRSDTPVFNWYLYSYGLVTVSLFAGAYLLAPPRDRVRSFNARALLLTLGTILTFLLVNIQIADFFTPPGSASLTFKFSGNFGRDMTYSIAWALFALGLLTLGLIKEVAAARYAGLALLSITVLKLFFHDLANLAQLYRIGALVGVAVIAILASFLYQFFTSRQAKPNENKATLPTT